MWQLAPIVVAPCSDDIGADDGVCTDRHVRHRRSVDAASSRVTPASITSWFSSRCSVTPKLGEIHAGVHAAQLARRIEAQRFDLQAGVCR